MVKINHIKHKNSDVADKAPKATDIVNGEIAVNYAKNTERMYIKNESGKIIPFSADHIIIDSVLNTVLMDRTMGKGYNVSNPTLANVYGSKEALNMVLKHYKMGLFKDGALVKECAPCRITKAVDGSEIKIDGSEGDIMLYTDVPIYRDRCRVSGVTVPNSTATTHNMIGLGLMPHQIGWKDAKKMNPFAFTPGYVQLDRDTNQYRSCYNPSFSGSGSMDYFGSSKKPEPSLTTNFIGENGAQGGYPVMCQSAVDSMQRSRNKGLKYQGIFYEFYEMWLIAMYLELGSLYFTDIDSFGKGCFNYVPSASNWISGGSSGTLTKNFDKNIDYYYHVYGPDIKFAGSSSGTKPLYGLLGYNYANFEEALESQRFVDALVRCNLTNKVDGTTVLEYDANGDVKVSDGVNLSTGENMVEGKKYYIIRNVPKCQGIGDGVMTYVLNVFVKTRFNSGVYSFGSSLRLDGKEIIFKFSYPTYRGLELFSGALTHIEGINHIHSYDGKTLNGSLWYAKDYTDIKYDPTNFTEADYKVTLNTPDEDIPYIKGFVKAFDYNTNKPYGGWVKNTNYDVSLYCATEFDSGASDTSYESSMVNVSGFGISGSKIVGLSAVGCNLSSVASSRTLDASTLVFHVENNITYRRYAGGFSIGNPSL